MNPVIRFFILSNIYVSFCVVALALSTQFIFSSYNIDVVIFLFFATLISYNFQRIISIYNIPEHSRRKWFDNHSNLIYFIITISLIIFINLFLGFNKKSQLLIVVISFFSFMYPFVLRTIPYIKIYLIALVWCLSTVLLTVIENNLVISIDVILSLISRFFFIVAITIPFDIRDIKFDVLKLKTIPILFGIEMSKKVALIMLYVYASLELIQHLLITPNKQIIFSAFLSCIYTQYLIKGSHEKQSGFYYSFWVESCSLALLFFLIITSIFL